MARFGPAPIDQEVRFWRYVEPEPNSGCWLWIGARKRGGYGIFERYHSPRRVSNTAYKFSYELHRGLVPDGLELDHLCRVHECVNPWHLEAVSRGVNLRRGAGFNAVNGNKTHCLRGHPFSGVNLK